MKTSVSLDRSDSPPLFRYLPPRPGFSLVELLVVIAVIAILLALLLPAIGASRASSRAAKCSRQLGEIGLALTRANREGDLASQWITRTAPFLASAGPVLRCPDDMSDPANPSYGLNSRTMRFSAGDSERIVMLEYKQAVANVVGTQGTDDWPDLVAPRHRGSLFVLVVDGGVHRRTPAEIDPRVCEIHDRLWRPTADSTMVKTGCDRVVSQGPSGGTASAGTGGAATGGTTTAGATASGGATTTGGSSTSGTTTSSTTSGTTTGSAPFCNRPALPGLIARYKFDDPNDPGADSSGNGFHATQLLGVDWENDGAHCGVVHFSRDGAGDTQDKIYVPDAIVNGKTNLTLANWFKTTSTQEQVFLCTATSSCSANELVYELEVNTAFWYHDHCPQTVWTSGTISAVRDGTWHHAAVVRNASASNLTLYIDGVSMGTLSLGASSHIQPFNGIYTMMGQEQDCPNGCTSPAQRMIGRLDELQVYGRVLTPAEIQTLAAPP